jgi:hypothetical protein
MWVLNRLQTTLTEYSSSKQLQISNPNLCKKANRRPHRHTFSKHAENKCLKNDDQHSCRLERAQSFSSFLLLSSSSFCHRWRKTNWSQSIRSKTDRQQLRGQTYSHKPFTVAGSDHDKTEKWPEKFIPQWRHHLRHNIFFWGESPP